MSKKRSRICQGRAVGRSAVSSPAHKKIIGPRAEMMVKVADREVLALKDSGSQVSLVSDTLIDELGVQILQ